MRKYLQPRFLLFLVLSVLMFSTCEKHGRYDLLPLKVGNEFYYTYYQNRSPGASSITKGTETWKVLSESTQGRSINYTIELKLNATVTGLGARIITDSIRYMEISEDISSSMISFSSELSYWNISFIRYQNESQTDLKHEGYSSAESWGFWFKSDSGLTKYYYSHPPNYRIFESLHLDSIKIIK